MNIEVRTSYGSLIGDIPLPDSIDSIIVNCGDTLAHGESLVIHLPDTGADFYDVSVSYWWRDTLNNWQHLDLDTFVNNDSVVFDDSFFTHYGDIFLQVNPINGPMPCAGTEGNMSGNGSGYLYYSNIAGSARMYITSGYGVSSRTNEKLIPPCKMLNERDRLTRIARRLNLPVN